MAYNAAIPLLNAYSKEMKAYVRIKACTRAFIATLFIIAQNWKQPKCPQIEIHSYNGKLLSSKKEWTTDTKQCGLVWRILCKGIEARHKSTYGVILFTWNPDKAEPLWWKTDPWLLGSGLAYWRRDLTSEWYKGTSWGEELSLSWLW